VICGALKGSGLHLHTLHIFFNGTIFVRVFVIALTTGYLCVDTGNFLTVLVKRMGWNCDRIDTLGGKLRGRLLGFRATDNNETNLLFFTVGLATTGVCISEETRRGPLRV
jgi:hypothetical protein